MKAAFISATPMIPSGENFEEAIRFYTEQMGFRIIWQDENMAGVARDAVAFNVLRNNNREWGDNSSFSIGVSDLDALYEEFRNVPVRVGPLEKKPWGRREFHMIVPGGVCLQFYEREHS
ncbi:MAG TPA: VOC family protein [Candidatus Kapabacteria bacterium]|nr:VOC family protein [Candidatus Kapabacteria bacterium]